MNIPHPCRVHAKPSVELRPSEVKVRFIVSELTTKRKGPGEGLKKTKEGRKGSWQEYHPEYRCVARRTPPCLTSPLILFAE